MYLSCAEAAERLASNPTFTNALTVAILAAGATVGVSTEMAYPGHVHAYVSGHLSFWTRSSRLLGQHLLSRLKLPRLNLFCMLHASSRYFPLSFCCIISRMIFTSSRRPTHTSFPHPELSAELIRPDNRVNEFLSPIIFGPDGFFALRVMLPTSLPWPPPTP
jgi:hypothetical protein